MSALAHHCVVARRVDSEGVTIHGTVQTWQEYCTLDEAGIRSVAKTARARFGADAVRVTLSCGEFDVDVLSDGS